MIRYALAVIFLVAILGISFTAIDHVAQTNSQQQMDANIHEIEEAANSLITNDEVPAPGQYGAQRIVTVELPDDSLTSDPVTLLEIRPEDGNQTAIDYRIDGGPTNQRTIDAPIVYEPDGALELGSQSGETVELVFLLTADDDNDPVVAVWEDESSVDNPR